MKANPQFHIPQKSDLPLIVKHSLIKAAMFSFGLVFLFLFSEKFGCETKFIPYRQALSWEEFFEKLPTLLKAYVMPVLIITVISFVWHFFTRPRNYGLEDTFYICPNCQQVYQEQLEAVTCGICKVPLEELTGFYERHPEKKQDN
jgi:hypothetical protein